LDYGRKRIGVAVTDPLQIIANPLDTVRSHEIIPFLKHYFEKEEVEAIVLGYPRKLDLSDTDITQDVLNFEKKLLQIFPSKKVILQDERLTSRMAMDAMIAGGMKKKDRRNKSNIDRISATLILQEYLQTNKP